MTDDSVTVVDSNSLDACLKSDHRFSHAHFTYLKIAGKKKKKKKKKSQVL